MDSNSGIIDTQETHVTEHFSSITPIPCKGFNSLCKAKRYGRWWLLKGLKEEYRQQETYRQLLRKEFDILISLQHPNIVSALSCEEIPGMGYGIVMEWIDGRTLGDFIKEQEESNEYGESIRSIVMQLLDALEYIHAKQIVHRDLKPANIMVTYNGNRVKLIDFGLSDADSYAILKQPAGTRRYISPEQASSRQADIRNDIYSLGCILEDMHLGRRYASVIARCKAPMADRYANAAEVRLAFLAAEKGKRHKVAAAAVGIATVAVLAIIGYSMQHGKEDTAQPQQTATNALVQETKYADSKNDTAGQNGKQAETKVTAEQQRASENNVSASKAAEKEEEALLAEGKRLIDEMWQQAGISKTTSITDKGEALTRFTDQSNDFIRKTFPQKYCAGISKDNRRTIIYELSEYVTDKYVKPTLDEFQQAQQ